MAYPISNDLLAMFQDDDRMHIARITMGSTTIYHNRIMQGGLSANRYCTTGENAMVGACVAGESNIVLDNHDGYFNSTNFVGQEIFIEVGVVDDNDDEQYIPLGYFEIDESPRKLSQIRITALDRMLFFEQKIDWTQLSFPCTVVELLNDICSICGVTLASLGTLTNSAYNITETPSIAETYRDLLSYICEITGTNAYFDWNGELALGWYSSSSAVTLTPANRYDSDTSEQAVAITGVKIVVGEEEYVAGTDAYNITIAQNPLITHDEQAVATALYQAIYPFQYKAFSATVMPMPHLYPMDGLTYVDKDGNSFFCAITDWTFKLNGNTALRGRGQTATQVTVGKSYGVSQNGADLTDAINILRANIIRTAEVINQNMETLEQTLTGQIEAVSSEFGEYKQESSQKIEANANGVTQTFTDIQNINTSVNNLEASKVGNADFDDLSEAVGLNTTFRSETSSKIHTGVLWYEGNTPIVGIAISQGFTYQTVNGQKVIVRQGFYSTYTAEELAFYVGTTKVAYVSNNQLYITEANVLNSAQIGHYILSDEGVYGFTIRWGGN